MKKLIFELANYSRISLFFVLFLSLPLLIPLSAQIDCTSGPSPQIITDVANICQEEKEDQRPEECIFVCEFSVVEFEGIVDASSTIVWQVYGGSFDAGYNSTSNPVKILWGAAGNGSLLLTETDSDGCSSTVELCIEIIDSPEAKFTSMPADVGGEITICEGGEIFFLDDSSSDVVAWEWDFGDGNFSNLENPSNTYDVAPGVYEVTLTVYNDCGCSSTTSKKVIVKEGWTPIIECISTVCDKAYATYTVTNACNTAVFNWTITNGQIISQSGNQVTVEWWAAADGYLGVSVTGCDDICPATAYVHIPIIGSGLNIFGPTTVCLGDYVQYNVPNQPGSTFEWKHNGFTISYNSIVDIEFTYPGTHTISVSITSPGTICPEEVENLSIVVTVKPKFDFNIEEQICEGDMSPYTTSPGGVAPITFVAVNVGGITTPLASSTTVINTSTLSPGVYQIVATGPGTYCNEPIQVLTVFGKPATPNASDVSGNFVVCPNSIQEYIYVVPADMIPTWSVLGGTIQGNASNPNVVVEWGASGPYALYVNNTDINNVDCPSDNATIAITEFVVSPLNVTTTPTAGITNFCANGTQSFIATPATNVSDYEWSITLPSPNIAASIVTGNHTNTIEVEFHNYNGPANIRLVAKVCGTDVITNYPININSYAVDITTALTDVCHNDVESHSATIIPGLPGGTTVSYAWFVDGVLQAGSNLLFSNLGTSTVSVIATLNGGSCDGVQLTDSYTVNVLPNPVTNISAPNGTVYCGTNLPLIASIQLDVSNPATTYNILWSTGSMTTNAIATGVGNYSITVTNNITGCKTVESINISGNCTPPPPCTIPTPVLNEGCGVLNASIPLPPSTNVVWNFGDNTPTASGTVVSHTYTQSGIYWVSTTVETSPGVFCTKVNQVIVHFIPRFATTFQCGSPYMLTNLVDQTDHIVSPGNLNYNWILPAGTVVVSGTTTSPFLQVHFNGLPSPQVVTLEVTVFGELCTYSYPVNFPSPIQSSFTVPSPRCVGADVNFNNIAYGANDNLLWNFGDGASSTNSDPTRAYENPGTYTATLTVTDEYGCTDISSATVVITPDAYASGLNVTPANSIFCDGNTVNLISSPISPNAPVTYSWTNNITTPVGPNAPNYNNVGSTGSYQLLVEDNLGCSDKFESAQVTVLSAPYAVVRGQDYYCAGDDVTLNAYAGTGVTYQWYRNGSLITNTSHILSLNNVGTWANGWTYYVIIDDGTCQTTSPTFTLDVRSGPSITLNTIDPCIPATYSVSSPDDPNVTYVWSNGDTGANATFSSGGQAFVIGYSVDGCSTVYNFEVFEGPDVSDIAVGCYCFDRDEVKWQLAPIGPNYTYHIEDSNGNVIIDNGDATVTLTYSEIYTVTVTNTTTGCTTTTDPIILDLKNCRECQFEGKIIDVECVGIDAATGGTIYSYTIDFTNYAIGLNGLAGTSPNGIVNNGTITPNSLAGGGVVTTVTGTFIAMNPNNPFCITFTGTGANGITCSADLCFKDLPDCGGCEGCDLDLKKNSVACINTIDGKSYFQYRIEYNKGDCPLIDLFWKPEKEEYEISVDNNVINANSSGLITGDIELPEGYTGDLNLVLMGVNPFTGEICYYEVTLKIPECENHDDCNEMEKKKSFLKCVGTDSYGFNVYEFNIDFTSPIVNGDVLILPLTGQYENQVSGLNISTAGNDYSINGLITDVPPFDDPVCFYIATFRNGKFCHMKLCLKAPLPCGSAMIAPDFDENEIFSNEEIGLDLVPNPANNKIDVSFNGATLGSAFVELRVFNQLGQIQHHIKGLKNNFNFPIDLTQDPDGVYTMVILSNGRVVEVSRYVVQH